MPHGIKHLVVLMMENRSFDHMLGFMPGINGLTGNETNPLGPEGPMVQVSRNARTVNDLIPDPGHEFINVNVQIFGDSAATLPVTMQGFVTDYWMVSHDNNQAPNVMKCFTPDTLPVLHTLAREYAVCDCWFSSVPGSTIPNRLFTHAANTAGSLTQDAIAAPFAIRTIFEEMDVPPNPANYRIYTHGSSILMANGYLQRNKQDRFFDFLQDFANDANNGDLPEYTFIEPAYDDDVNNGIFANSQHPDFPVDEGEALISKVYAALTQSPEWADTLLLITYDEHGGIFDHVPPPPVTRSAANAGLPDVPPSTSPAFAFDRLGVRVPAVFVSPRIAPGAILPNPGPGQFYEHCSIVSTVRKLFCGPAAKTPFNWREAQAATFENLLVLDNPRADVVLPTPVPSAALTESEISNTTRMIVAGNTTSIQAGVAGPTVVQPISIPRTPPPTRSPTDLILLMAQAMDHSLRQRGIQPPSDVKTIYTAQDATTFIRAANAAAAAGGGQ